MISLPIPEPVRVDSARPYAEIGSSAGLRIDALLQSLTGGRVWRKGWQMADRAHLDPDLDEGSITPRPDGWRPAFGQWSSAQSHLQNQGVAENDIFLFFGWFHAVVELDEGSYQYDPDASDLHVCYGWLQIGEILSGTDLVSPPDWLRGHPHIPPYDHSDRIYLAADRLDLPGLKEKRPGGGIFGRYASARCLTADKPRSVWRLPGSFHPGNGGKRPLSYHGTRNKDGVLQRWLLDLDQPDHTRLDSAKQGQEFVLHTADYPDAIPWLARMFAA